MHLIANAAAGQQQFFPTKKVSWIGFNNWNWPEPLRQCHMTPKEQKYLANWVGKYFHELSI